MLSGGVPILHGTDTMAHSAAWLILCSSGVGIPIILTGSQLTLDYTLEDVSVNLRGDAQMVHFVFRGPGYTASGSSSRAKGLT